LSPREWQAFLAAPAVAPAVTTIAGYALSQILIVATVSYVAAFAIGYPAFRFIRRRGGSRARSSLVAGIVAGTMAGGLLTATMLYVMAPGRPMSDPAGFGFFSLIGAVVGAGLGLLSGLTLWGLLSASNGSDQGA
jgi:hypothetical protein